MLLKIIIFINSLLLIGCVLLQPSERTGLIGDATDSEKHEKRDLELMLYRVTIILIFILLVSSTLFGAINSGFFKF